MNDLWFMKEQIENEKKAARFSLPWGKQSFRSHILQDWLTMHAEINTLRAELRKWQTGEIVGIEFVPKMFDSLEKDRDNAVAERDNLRRALDEYQGTIDKWVNRANQYKDRCVELELRLDVGTGNLYEVVVAENERLRARNAEVCKALSDLYDACMQADGEGELYYTIDGDLLDAARKAMRDET